MLPGILALVTIVLLAIPAFYFGQHGWNYGWERFEMRRAARRMRHELATRADHERYPPRPGPRKDDAPTP